MALAALNFAALLALLAAAEYRSLIELGKSVGALHIEIDCMCCVYASQWRMSNDRGGWIPKMPLIIRLPASPLNIRSP